MDRLSGILSALSHPLRRDIIKRLAKGPARVTEIAEPFEMSLNSVSKHLKVLEQAGLIRRERQWRDHIIEIQGAPLREVAGWVHEYERFWSEHLDQFVRYFKDQKKTKEKKK